jgi:hypothetical protein
MVNSVSLARAYFRVGRMFRPFIRPECLDSPWPAAACWEDDSSLLRLGLVVIDLSLPSKTKDHLLHPSRAWGP